MADDELTQPTNKPTVEEWLARLSGLRQMREAFWNSHPDGPDEGRRQNQNYVTLKDVLGPSDLPKKPKSS